MKRGSYTDEVVFPVLPRRICKLAGSRSVMIFGDESHHEGRRHHKKRYPVLPEPAEWSDTSLHLSDDCHFGTVEGKQIIPWLCPLIALMGVLGGSNVEVLPSSHILGSPHCVFLYSLEWDLRQLDLGKKAKSSQVRIRQPIKSQHTYSQMSRLSTILMTTAATGPAE